MAPPYLGQHQREEDGEADDEEIALGIEVHELEVGEADSRYDAKHHAEDAADDGGGHGEEEGAHLAHHSEEDEDERGVLDDPSAAHL